MPRLMLQFLFLLAIGLFSAGPAAAEALASRTSVVGGVTVKVTPQALGAEAWEFEVVLDTHSRDLGDDLATSVVLVTEKGELAPLGWKGDRPGGHHRKGILRFQRPALPGQTVRLRMNLAGEAQPRLFEWEHK